MNRDVFPRGVTEDALLPDRLRRGLETLLPDIQIKQRGHAEERYLFAQLCSAAPSLALSWQEVSDDGKELAPSPLVERLRLAGAGPPLDVVSVPPVLEGANRERPAHEHALCAGLAGDGGRFADALRLSFAGAGAAGAEPLAAARLAVVSEIDSLGRGGSELGPYYGFVGPLAQPGTERLAEEIYVTRLESIATCGWRTFLERVLGLEPVPDALAALPEVEPRLVGNVLHRVLEQIVEDAGASVGGTLEEAWHVGPVDVPWPSQQRLESLLRESAERVAAQAGIVLPGFGRVLSQRVRPQLERVREREVRDGVLPGVIGAELEGTVRLEGADGRWRTLRFRADRVDATPAGLRLVDYKSGKPISSVKDPEKRQAHLHRRISEGRNLQAAAYAFAEGPAIEHGRYLFARPDLEEVAVAPTVERSDPEARRRLAAAVEVLARSWERGVLFPRMLDHDLGGEPVPCTFCEVSSACLRWETGALRRFRDWIERSQAPSRDASLSESERILLETFLLGSGESAS
jgi:RecB family exonuclease